MYSKGKNTDIGLLFLRLAIGGVYIGHGFPGIVGGPELWIEAGSAMQYLGVHYFHDIFGFLFGAIKLFGGILLIFGFGTVPTLLLLLFTIFITLVSKFAAGVGYAEISHPLITMIVFITLMITGPGAHSIDNNIMNRRRY